MHRLIKQIPTLLLITLLAACGNSTDDVEQPPPAPPVNQAPIADAGADQTVNEAVVVTLQGSGVDADGSIASYSWVETSGPTVFLSDDDTDTASFNSPMTAEQLTLTFELTVTDDQGATATDEVEIIVDPVMVIQTVVAGEATLIEIDSAELMIPADVLDAGVEVSVRIVELETLAVQPIRGAETLISPIYQITFSKVQTASVVLLFSFMIDPQTKIDGAYARLSTEGGIFSEGITARNWSVVFDRFGSPDNQYVIELHATANSYLIAGINLNTLTSTHTSNIKNTTTINAIESTSSLKRDFVVDRTNGEKIELEFANHGWLILCDSAEYTEFNNTACDVNNPTFSTMMNDLGAKLYTSDKTLTALGFPIGATSFAGINSSYVVKFNRNIYDPENRSNNNIFTVIDPDKTYENQVFYHVAWISADNVDDFRGLYGGGSKKNCY